MSLDPLQTPTTVRVTPPIAIGHQVHDTVVVERLRAGPAQTGVAGGHASIIVEAITGDGESIQRAVSFEVLPEYEIVVVVTGWSIHGGPGLGSWSDFLERIRSLVE